MIFVVYGADMEQWLEHAKAFTYADDSTTSVEDEKVDIVLDKLKKDGQNVLKFMASNGLVANPSKTVFLLLGNKTDEEQDVMVGGKNIPQSKTTKLLGMHLDRDQKWNTHFTKLVGALGQRLFQVRRVARILPSKGLRKITDSLWTSKLRYGLQLCNEVRTEDEQPKCIEMGTIQKAQNRMLRVLTKSKIKDKVKISDMLKSTNMLSVNQTAAQIKMTEMWKVENLPKYPIKMEIEEKPKVGLATRSGQEKKYKELGRTKTGRQSFIGDAPRLWNKAPAKIKAAKSLYTAKKEIRLFCKTLPV